VYILENIYASALTKYLNNNGIFIEEDTKKNGDCSVETIKRHIEVLSEFHKRMIGYKALNYGVLPNSTGKLMERYKINNKKLKRQIRLCESKEIKSGFEVLLMDKGTEILARAEHSINEAYRFGYLEALSRSMKRGEICIGNSALSNIKMESNISIGDISDLGSNILELDAVYLLRKVKKNYCLDFEALAKYFCEKENLPESSKNLILALVSYPHYFMKCFNRYREGRKDWDDVKFTFRLQEALVHDGKILI